MLRAERACRLLLVILFIVVASRAVALERSDQEIELENRLIAPCCWVQTLVNHESPIASALRREIRERLVRGERGEQIEDDLARRYGERIRAVPRGTDPFHIVPILLGIGMSAIAFVLYRLARPGHLTAGASTAEHVPTLSSDDEERLDDELDRFDA